MPTLPISNLLGTPSIKIIDELTKVVRWPKIKIRSVEIALESDNAAIPLSNVQVNSSETYVKLLEADLRTGKIIRPSHIKLSFWSPDNSTTEGIVQAFMDPTATFQVTSKSIISNSMAIISMEMEQTPENLSATAITMEMEQTDPPGSDGDYDPAQPADQSARGVRIQTPVSLTQSVTGLYNKVSNAIGTLT